MLRLLLDVHDWQGMKAGANVPQIQTVEVSSPDLFSGTVNAVRVNDTPTRAEYSVDLTCKVNPHAPGNAVVVVRVESKGGPTYKQTTAPAPSDNISAFSTVIVPITDPACTADTNNSFADAVTFNLSTPIVGQLCAPTDSQDFYKFQFNPGDEISGNLILDCNEANTKITLYDKNQVKITDATASSGKATIDLGALNLLPDQYYIEVSTTTTGRGFLYMLESTATVTDVTPKPSNITPSMLYTSMEWADSDGTYSYLTGPDAFWIFDFASFKAGSQIGAPLSRTYMISTMKPGIAYPWACFAYQPFFGKGSLSLMDMTNPSSPTVYNNVYTSPLAVDAVNMDSNYLYVAINDGTQEKLVILDYKTNPSAPVLKSDSYVVSSQVQSLDSVNVSGHTILIITKQGANSDAADVTDPTNPQFFANFGWGSGEIRGVTVQNDLVYVIYNNGVSTTFNIVQVDPGLLTVRGFFVLSHDCYSVAVRGNWSYTTDNANTITVVDV